MLISAVVPNTVDRDLLEDALYKLVRGAFSGRDLSVNIGNRITTTAEMHFLFTPGETIISDEKIIDLVQRLRTDFFLPRLIVTIGRAQSEILFERFGVPERKDL